MTIDSLARKLYFKYAESQTLLSPTMPGASRVNIPKPPAVPIVDPKPSEEIPDSSPPTPHLNESPKSSRDTVIPYSPDAPEWKNHILSVLDDMYHTNVLAPYYYRELQEKVGDILNESDLGGIKKELHTALSAAEKHAESYAEKLRKIKNKIKL